MAEKKATQQQSRTSRRSSGLIVSDPKAIAWAWRRGVKVGQGRNPDFYLFNEEDVVDFERTPDLYHVVRVNSAWVSGGSASTGKRK